MEDFGRFQKRKLEILAGQIGPGERDEGSVGETEISRKNVERDSLAHGSTSPRGAKVRKVAVISIPSVAKDADVPEGAPGGGDGGPRKRDDSGGKEYIPPGGELPPEALLSEPVRETVVQTDHGNGTAGEVTEKDMVRGEVTELKGPEVPVPLQSTVLVGSPRTPSARTGDVVEGVILLDNEEEVEEDDRYNYYDISGDEEPLDEEVDSRGSRRGGTERRNVKGPVFAVVTMIILVSLGAYILNPDLIPSIWNDGDGVEVLPDIRIISPRNDSTYASGVSVSFEVSVDYPEDKILGESWEFGDGESEVGRKTTHFYSTGTDRSFRATYRLTTTKNRNYEASVTIRISPLTIVLPEKMDGLGCRYDITSKLLFDDPDGIEMLSGDTGDVSITRVDLSGDGTMDVDISVSGEGSVDGFLMDHDVYERSADIDMELEGNATVRYTYLLQEQEGDMKLEGELISNNVNYFDLATENVIKSSMKSNLELYSEYDPSTPFQVVDEIISYQELSDPPLNMDITEIRENRTFRLGDAEPGGVGGLHYMWSIGEMDNVAGSPALKVDVKLQRDLLNTYGITGHTITLWISDGKALPVKFFVHLLREEGDSLSSVTIEGIVDPISYIGGIDPLSAMTCDEGYNATHHHASRSDELDPGLAGEFREMQYAPVNGELKSDLKGYSIDEAMAVIRGSSEFNEYLSSHPKSFAVDARCNESSGRTLWNVTFGEKGSNEGLNFLVRDTGALSSVGVEVDVDTYAFDLGEVLSYSGAVYAFENDPDIADRMFDQDGLDLSQVTVGSGISLPTISVEAFYSGTVNNLDFGFFLSRESSTASGSESSTAVLNGITGQILYLTDHMENAPDMEGSWFF